MRRRRRARGRHSDTPRRGSAPAAQIGEYADIRRRRLIREQDERGDRGCAAEASARPWRRRPKLLATPASPQAERSDTSADRDGACATADRSPLTSLDAVFAGTSQGHGLRAAEQEATSRRDLEQDERTEGLPRGTTGRGRTPGDLDPPSTASSVRCRYRAPSAIGCAVGDQARTTRPARDVAVPGQRDDGFGNVTATSAGR